MGAFRLITLFSIALLVGTITTLAWVAAAAVGSTVDGWRDVDPERRFGRTGRLAVVFVFGFGMAGISASFAGWTGWLSMLAALAGGCALSAAAVWLGPVSTT